LIIVKKSISVLLLACMGFSAHAAPFLDQFDTLDAGFWYAGDGWANGAPFNVGWRADHAQASGGELALNLDSTPCPGGCSGYPYASANVASNAKYGYGTVYGRFQAAAGSGLVTSLFTYAGPDSGSPHDEIDIEILGKDTTKAQFNFFANGSVGNEFTVDLGFDASQGMHDYGFTWTPAGISWYVDGSLRYSVSSAGVSLPVTPGQIMVNLWAVDGSAAGWAGTYDGTPATALYDYVGFAPYSVPEPGALWLLFAAIPLITGCARWPIRDA
jgi:beta-glucanase (GH16 family)